MRASRQDAAYDIDPAAYALRDGAASLGVPSTITSTPRDRATRELAAQPERHAATPAEPYPETRDPESVTVGGERDDHVGL